MKKIAKISLVAAIAVAGFTTANAQPLEEAIKNVDVSGSVVYRYNDASNDAKNDGVAVRDNASGTNNNYKVALNLASKVNDDVKFNSRFLAANANGSADFASLTTQSGDASSDANPGLTVSNAYFGYTGLKNTTVNVGKQGLTTPWTVATQADGQEQTGTGILALSTVGPVTLAGGYFNQTNLNVPSDARIGGFGDATVVNNVATYADADINGLRVSDAGLALAEKDIMTAGAIVAAGPATIDAWYLDLQERFDSFTVGAKATTKLAGIDLGADARFASLKFDKNLLETDEDQHKMAKLVLTGDAGLIDAKLAYATTGKEGGLTALDNDATTTLLGWNITANGKADADYIQAVVGVDILSNLNLSANYGNIEYVEDVVGADKDTVEEEEVYAQLSYTMSKNLSTYVRYGTYTKDAKFIGDTETTHINDDTRGRLQVKYTF